MTTLLHTEGVVGRKNEERQTESCEEWSGAEQSRVEFGRVEVRYTLPSIV